MIGAAIGGGGGGLVAYAAFEEPAPTLVGIGLGAAIGAALGLLADFSNLASSTRKHAAD